MFFFGKDKFKSINVNEVDSILENINLIDVREPDEYRRGHLPKAKNIPMNSIIENSVKYLDKNKEYHIICQSGMRSKRTCNELYKKGFNVVNVEGGTGSYKGKLVK